MKCSLLGFSIFIVLGATAHQWSSSDVSALHRRQGHGDIYRRGTSGWSTDSEMGESSDEERSKAVVPTTKVAFGKGQTDTTRAEYLKKQRWQKSLWGTGPMRPPSYMRDTTSSILKNKEYADFAASSKTADIPDSPKSRQTQPSKGGLGGKPGYLKETASSAKKKAWASSSSPDSQPPHKAAPDAMRSPSDKSSPGMFSTKSMAKKSPRG